MDKKVEEIVNSLKQVQQENEREFKSRKGTEREAEVSSPGVVISEAPEGPSGTGSSDEHEPLSASHKDTPSRSRKPKDNKASLSRYDGVIYISQETRLEIMSGIINYVRKKGKNISMKDFVALAVRDFNNRLK